MLRHVKQFITTAVLSLLEVGKLVLVFILLLLLFFFSVFFFAYPAVPMLKGIVM